MSQGFSVCLHAGGALSWGTDTGVEGVCVWPRKRGTSLELAGPEQNREMACAW